MDIDLFGAELFPFHDVGDERRIDAAAARAHDQPFEGRESHGRIDGPPAVHGGDAGPVAEMAGDDLQALDRALHELRGASGDIVVGGPVEAVPPDPELLVESVGEAVNERPGRDRLMKRGVENPDLEDPGEQGFAGLDPLQVVRVMQRRELDALPDRGLDLLGDQGRFGEIFAAVDDAVADAVDLALVPDDAVLGMEQQGEDHLDGDAVVQDFPDLPDLVLALRLIGDDGIARTDLLDDAFAEKALVLHPHELKLDGRTAAVQDEDFHGP